VSWLLIIVVATWALSLLAVVWLDRVAGDDPQGAQDPDAPSSPGPRTTPPPLPRRPKHS
jgi:hypothetical protein